MPIVVCQRRMAKGLPCGGPRRVTPADEMGPETSHCPWCARFDNHQCRDCANPRAGRSPWCPPHRTEHRRLVVKAHELTRVRPTWKAWWATLSDAEKTRHRARKAANARRLVRTARGKAMKKRWRETYKQRHPKRVAAQNRKHSNAARPERAIAKREHAKKYRVNPKPRCRRCFRRLVYTGVGTPPSYCYQPCAPSWAGPTRRARMASRVKVIDA